jgi:hypothetical protein
VISPRQKISPFPHRHTPHFPFFFFRQMCHWQRPRRRRPLIIFLYINIHSPPPLADVLVELVAISTLPCVVFYKIYRSIVCLLGG